MFFTGRPSSSLKKHSPTTLQIVQHAYHTIFTKIKSWFTASNNGLYPISRADLSVAATGTGEGGDLWDRDTLLPEAHQIISTLCSVVYQTRAHVVTPQRSSECTVWDTAVGVSNYEWYDYHHSLISMQYGNGTPSPHFMKYTLQIVYTLQPI